MLLAPVMHADTRSFRAVLGAGLATIEPIVPPDALPGFHIALTR